MTTFQVPTTYNATGEYDPTHTVTVMVACIGYVTGDDIERGKPRWAYVIQDEATRAEGSDLRGYGTPQDMAYTLAAFMCHYAETSDREGIAETEITLAERYSDDWAMYAAERDE